MHRFFLLLFALCATSLGAAAHDGGVATALFYDLVDGQLVDYGARRAEVRYEWTDESGIVISDFMGSGRDLAISLGETDGEGYSYLSAIGMAGGHDHGGRHFYLCPDYGSMAMGRDDRTDCLLTDFCWLSDNDEGTVLCLTYWSEVRERWNVCIVDFASEYVPRWNGRITFPEAASRDDLLHCTIGFEWADSVTSGPADVLGVIFDQSGEPYAIAFCGADFSYIGHFSEGRDAAVVDFVRFADLDASLQSSMRISAGRLAGHGDGASVVFASKSFVVDGEVVGEVLVHEYDFPDGSLVTGDVLLQAADAPTDVRGAYDASGRRMERYDRHCGRFYIDEGRKRLGR